MQSLRADATGIDQMGRVEAGIRHRSAPNLGAHTAADADRALGNLATVQLGRHSLVVSDMVVAKG